SIQLVPEPCASIEYSHQFPVGSLVCETPRKNPECPLLRLARRIVYHLFVFGSYTTCGSQKGEPLLLTPDQNVESESVLTVPPVLLKIRYCELMVSNKWLGPAAPATSGGINVL